METPNDMHPRAQVLIEFASGILGDAEASRVDQHLLRCPACRASVDKVSKGSLPLHSFPAHPEAHYALAKPLPALTEGQIPTVDFQRNQPTIKQLSELPASQVPQDLLNHPRYRLLEVLGFGGMGIVFKAEHRFMERLVALKVIHPEMVDRPGMIERFHREVKTAGRLAHPNIVPAFDAEQWRQCHFLVMELVPGRDLEKIACADGPLPVADACEYVRQTALGLQYANVQGMVHRDIKPNNLMVTPHRRVKILDFGLARFASESTVRPDPPESPVLYGFWKGLTEVLIERDTGKGWVLGTPDYLAPEEARDARQADIRADIYSLGCTLYRLLAGRVPFPDGTVDDKIKAHAFEKAVPLTALRPDTPAKIAEAVEKMMAKDPEARQQTPLEVARAMVPFALGGD